MWWRRSGGVPDFAGLKICADRIGVRSFSEIRSVRINLGNQGLEHELGRVGNGGNSGFHAVNLAAQAGARRIILVGFDYNLDGGAHWHGKHPAGLNNPTRFNVAKWRANLDAVADDLAAMKIEVINASAASTLSRYPKRSLREATQ